MTALLVNRPYGACRGARSSVDSKLFSDPALLVHLPHRKPRRTRLRPLLRLPLPDRRQRAQVKGGCGQESVRIGGLPI
jgi:hypothetical protein